MAQKERSCSMQSTMQSGLTFCFLLSVAVLPAAAQSDRFGGPVEFRSPDRPISVPTLRFPEAAGLSSDKLSSTSGMSAPENALKQLDMELGRTLSRSEPGRRGPPDKTDDQREERAQAKGTFK